MAGNVRRQQPKAAGNRRGRHLRDLTRFRTSRVGASSGIQSLNAYRSGCLAVERSARKRSSPASGSFQPMQQVQRTLGSAGGVDSQTAPRLGI